MGVAVSGWRLARAVSIRGQLGVVSGTAADAVLARRLQLGDPGGHIRSALDAFPIPEIADRVLDRYFRPEGLRADHSFRSKPVPTVKFSQSLTDLTVLANFVEVHLAKRGQDGWVGINLLEKVQLPTLPALFGAMLAGVDFVLMGAGIPRQIPGVLDSLAALQETKLRLDVAGSPAAESKFATFHPTHYISSDTPELTRPKFLAIVSSNALATHLVKRCTPPVDGLVIEGPTAGGHNAPPRGPLQFDEDRNPIYGPKDDPEIEAIRELGVPFWLAGEYGSREKLHRALELGATGIQVGTPFAFCQESGLAPEIKAQVLDACANGTAHIRTDAGASPTGFPFKVVSLEGSLSEQSVYEARERICDLGYLRQPYLTEKGTIGYRCASEPIEDFIEKGGSAEETENRKCLCNGLLAAVGLGQRRSGVSEPPIVTAGDDLRNIARFLSNGKRTYTADDVLDDILAASDVAPPQEART
ncbi:MAG: nitronate monooxygenase [Armatimonadetes bacterium]|nr:nitronate monooxygenase [Armatimonadota bacterium]NOG93823.1 nitronate monooxygenase [Armatimonadota bacterium]